MSEIPKKRHLMTGSIRRSPIEKFEPDSARRIDTSNVNCMLFIPTSRSGWSSSIASAIFAKCHWYYHKETWFAYFGRKLHRRRHSSAHMQNGVTCWIPVTDWLLEGPTFFRAACISAVVEDDSRTSPPQRRFLSLLNLQNEQKCYKIVLEGLTCCAEEPAHAIKSLREREYQAY